MAADTGSADRLDQEVSRASHLCDLDRMDEAERRLRAVLAADPGHYGAGTLFAWLLCRTRRYQESYDVARQLIAAAPDRTGGYLRAGWALCSLGRDHDAEEYARQAVRLGPSVVDAHRLLAEVLGTIKGRGEEALAEAEEVLRLNPDSASAYVALATILVDLRRWNDAEQAMVDALARDPVSAANRMKLAIIRVQLKRFTEARDDFAAALRTNPTRQYLETVVDLWVSNGRPAELADLYRLGCTALGRPDLTKAGAASADPALADLQIEVVERLRTAGDHEEARAVVQGILAAHPGHREARSLLADLLKEDRKFDEAVAIAAALREEGHDTVGLHKTLIYSRSKTGAGEQAIEDAEEAARRHPDVPNFPFFIASFLIDLGRPADAVEPARHVVELDPDFRDGQLLLGRALRLAQRREEAADALRTAHRQYPGHWDAAVLLALTLWELEAHDEAETVARRAIELRPDDVSAYQILAHVLRTMPDRAEEAKRACEDVLARDPDDHEISFRLGMLYVHDENWAKAQPCLARAYALRPDIRAYRRILVMMTPLLGRFEEALAEIDSLLTEDPSTLTLTTIRRLLEGIGVPERFVPLYERACTALNEQPIDRDQPEARKERAEFAANLRAIGAEVQAAEVMAEAETQADARAR